MLQRFSASAVSSPAGNKVFPPLIQVNHSLPLKFIFEVSRDLNVPFMNADFFLACMKFLFIIFVFVFVDQV